MAMLMNLAFGVAPVDVVEGPWSRSPTCPRPTTPTWSKSTCPE